VHNIANGFDFEGFVPCQRDFLNHEGSDSWCLPVKLAFVFHLGGDE
jgi:hypothetical protein